MRTNGGAVKTIRKILHPSPIIILLVWLLCDSRPSSAAEMQVEYNGDTVATLGIQSAKNIAATASSHIERKTFQLVPPPRPPRPPPPQRQPPQQRGADEGRGKGKSDKSSKKSESSRGKGGKDDRRDRPDAGKGKGGNDRKRDWSDSREGEKSDKSSKKNKSSSSKKSGGKGTNCGDAYVIAANLALSQANISMKQFVIFD
jgi:hypothetical protein